MTATQLQSKNISGGIELWKPHPVSIDFSGAGLFTDGCLQAHGAPHLTLLEEESCCFLLLLAIILGHAVLKAAVRKKECQGGVKLSKPELDWLKLLFAYPFKQFSWDHCKMVTLECWSFFVPSSYLV